MDVSLLSLNLGHPATTLPLALAFIAGALVSYAVVKGVYNLYFHPLCNYPGPKLAAITNYAFVKSAMSSDHVWWRQRLHDKYGEIVRIGPNSLSFATASSFKDIYGHASKARGQFSKGSMYVQPLSLPTSIVLERDVQKHSEVRRSLSHGFSAKALREQEPLVLSYIDEFVAELRNAALEEYVNIVSWYSCVTIDIIGDLAFGEGFGATRQMHTGRKHFWIDVSTLALSATFAPGLWNRIPWTRFGLRWLLPPGSEKATASRIQFRAMNSEKIQRRQQRRLDRSDFLSHLINAKHIENPLSTPQLAAHATVLTTAGFETTATFLSGTTYHLLHNPSAMGKLQDEIRGTFPTAGSIDGDACAKLPFLNAVIEEGLRIFPPVPFVQERTSPGAMVSGHYIPAGVNVSTDNVVVSRSPAYWHEPLKFKPERWIDPNCNDNKEAMRPFSYGPRVCLGMNLAYLEMRLILARLVWEFDFECSNMQMNWEKSLGYSFLWRKPELMVRFKSVHREVSA